MTHILDWIERASFFGRPHVVKRPKRQVGDIIPCSEAAQQSDFSIAFASCREAAAGNCAVADFDVTWSGDACVCSTLGAYDKSFSDCILDTPYSECIDPNNAASLSVWSSQHCKATTSNPYQDFPSDLIVTTTEPPTTTKPPSTTTEPSSTSTEPPSTTEPPSSTKPVSNTPGSSKTPIESEQPPDQGSKSEPQSTSSFAESSTSERSSLPTISSVTSLQQSSSVSTTSSSSIPKPSLVPITVAPRISAQTTDSSLSASSIHTPIPMWAGSGDLLREYCLTPEYTLLDGPTAYWAPVVGCVSNKPDCCPFPIPVMSSTATVTGSVPPAVTIVAPGSDASATPTTDGVFPSAISPDQATLERCPDDYTSVSNGCCPSNYVPWGTIFGGQTPCYSSLSAVMTPPPLPDSLIVANATGSESSNPTSAIVNVVYAMYYPVKPASEPSLATNAKIGIGVGAGGAALVFVALLWLLLRKHLAHKRDRNTLKSISGMGSTRQSVAASSAVGGVSEWRKGIPGSPTGGRFYEGLEPLPERPTLPEVENSQRYPADWRPGQRTVSPISAPLPGSFVHRSMPSPPIPPIPEGFLEADGQHATYTYRYSNSASPGVMSEMESNGRSELQSSDDLFLRQELQGVPEGQGWQYHEAPPGRMTPQVR